MKSALTLGWSLIASVYLWSVSVAGAAPDPAKHKHWAYTAPQGAAISTYSAIDSAWARGRPVGAATQANDAVLVRRLSFVLRGLPPSVDELGQAQLDLKSAAEKGPEMRQSAWERLVDQWLASPRYAEHWARHWLDVSRFAQSLTLRGFVLPEAWRYRDYVVDFFHQDRSYQDFIREQIAGDLLSSAKGDNSASEAERARSMTGAMFLALGNSNLEEQNKRLLEMDIVDEQLDVLGKTFMGQTFGCARCHDHMFDPISTRDYYAMAGILKNVQMVEHDNVSKWIDLPLPLPESEALRYAEHERRVKELEGKIKAEKDAQKGSGKGSGPNAVNVESLTADLKRLKAEVAPRPVVHMGREVKEIKDLAIHRRGSVDALGESVPRGFPAEVDIPEIARPSSSESGRRELAEWLASPKNPLTARVMVNRLWAWTFGKGLVPSVDNFGTTGTPPTHPELLDGLALGFIDSGWSVKKMIRLMVTSQLWQERADAEGGAIDWRRLSAEEIRDAWLHVSGRLVHEGGGANHPRDLAADFNYTDTTSRRSLYVPAFRNARPDLFDLFDAPSPSLVTGQRDASAVATQALFLLNHPWVHEMATAAAQQALKHVTGAPRADGAAPSAQDHIQHAYQQALGREPLAEEVAQALDHLGASPHVDTEALTTFYHALMASVDFRYVD